MRKSEVMKGSVELAVLSMLGRKKMHGYKVTKELNLSTDRVLSIAEGTLYLMLKRLEKRKYIRANWEVGRGARKIHTYAITPAGRKELKARVAHWKILQGALNNVISN